ncbi:Golgi phosphoprotein 3 GPP34 [Micromonospora sp. Llam0]|uniref:GPP34 family phosphoprotein n=1 Tax=Micromonospora sp. Llam0 TaxID=2485143 RepID=UPI000F47AD1C|nr:GPP34 family phosphoprotein [Micromonospora sp. Llam0]ROO60378.1 Golgi phosphoprotein 3 GPP34 [Micromonospora sp. Llam0]
MTSQETGFFLPGSSTSSARPVADDLWRLAHDDVTGEPRLSVRLTGLGLAAALLGELVFAGGVWVDGVTVTIRYPFAPDDTTYVLLKQISANRQVDARGWLVRVADTAPGMVAERLRAAGHLQRMSTLGPGGRSVRYVPTDRCAAATPHAWLATRLRRREMLTHRELFLVGLAATMGLERRLVRDAEPHVRRHVDRVVEAIWPPAYDVVALLRAAAVGAVLTGRG